MKDEVDFLPADKSQMCPQIDTILLYYYYTITLGVWGQGMHKLPQKQKDNSSQCLYNISKRR